MTPAEQIARMSDLLGRQLGARGMTLEDRLRHRGRRLPRRIRRRAEELAAAERMANHPRLATQIDRTALDRALTEVETHLRGVRGRHRTDHALGVLGTAAAGAIAMFALGVAVMVWRGAL